jgi:hypothetical protein
MITTYPLTPSLTREGEIVKEKGRSPFSKISSPLQGWRGD